MLIELKKPIKKFKRGNGFRHEITITKQDIEDLNNANEVYIIDINEYESLQKQIKNKDETIAKQTHELNQTISDKDNEIKELHTKIDKHENSNKTIIESNNKLQQKIELLDIEHENFEKRNDKLIKENTELLRQNKYLKKELDNIKDISKKSDKLIKDLQKQHDETIEKLNKENTSQLKQTYDKFNNDLTRCITINQLQNQAFKTILELGFLDLIRNKHKKIAHDNIKKLDQKKFIEYVPKDES